MRLIFYSDFQDQLTIVGCASLDRDRGRDGLGRRRAGQTLVVRVAALMEVVQRVTRHGDGGHRESGRGKAAEEEERREHGKRMSDEGRDRKDREELLDGEPSPRELHILYRAMPE